MICYTNEPAPLKTGSPMLDCKYTCTLFLECSRVVTLAVVETVKNVCDDHCAFTFMLGKECSCTCFGGVNVYHKIFRKYVSCSTGTYVRICFTFAYT